MDAVAQATPALKDLFCLLLGRLLADGSPFLKFWELPLLRTTSWPWHPPVPGSDCSGAGGKSEPLSSSAQF